MKKHTFFLKSGLLVSLCLFMTSAIVAQTKCTQVLRGQIMDNASEVPIKDALIELLNVNPRNIDVSREDGAFQLDCIPVGRQRILVKANGYEDLLLTEINITAGKQVVLIIKLDEKIDEKKAAEIKKAPKKRK